MPSLPLRPAALGAAEGLAGGMALLRGQVLCMSAQCLEPRAKTS